MRKFLSSAFRRLWRNRGYSALNLFGLTIGLTSTLLILIWVQYELSFDDIHTQKANIYKVNAKFTLGDKVQTLGVTPAALAAFAPKEIPDVENVLRIRNYSKAYLVKYGEKFFTGTTAAFIDTSFFSIFDFQLIKGNQKNMFSTNRSVIVTEKTANRYFGDDDPIGKVIQVRGKDEFVVSGVIKDFPNNSSIHYDLLFSIDLLVNNYEPSELWKTLDSDWGNYDYQTFLLLRSPNSVPNVEKLLNELQRKNNSKGLSTHLSLQALENLHLYAPDGSDAGMQEVKMFFIVALVILALACINYVNLTTATATQLSKEVGIKKLVGARRVNLFAQFLGESIVLFTIAVLLSLIIVQMMMPVYSSLLERTLEFDIFSSSLLASIAGAFLFVVIAAGVYPARLLSGIQPLKVAISGLTIGRKSLSFRKVLVVIQFSFSIALMAGTLVIRNQMQFIRNKKLGYDRENTFILKMRGMSEHYYAVKSELEKRPEILAVTSADQNIIHIDNATGDTDWNGKEPDRLFFVRAICVDEFFFKMAKISLEAGRGFTGAPADSGYYILNQTAIEQAGISEPIGKRFKLWGKEGTIIGIAKDFHFASVHEKIEPAIFYTTDPKSLMYVKTTSDQASKAIEYVQKLWTSYNPGFPFEYEFLDETYDALYKSDRRTGQLINYFSGIAILLCCLGLFGLATFTAEQRTKEIGIRKVLGSSMYAIVVLLFKDFFILILASAIIGVPIAWLAMTKWMERYAYKADISIWIFFLSGFAALMIGAVTVSYQSISAARANPVRSLRQN